MKGGYNMNIKKNNLNNNEIVDALNGIKIILILILIVFILLFLFRGNNNGCGCNNCHI